MKRLLLLVALVAFTLTAGFFLASGASAAGPEWVIVNPGETLTMIAARYGITVQALVSANNLPNANFVYSGQRLLIPDTLMTFAAQPQANPAASAQPVPVLPSAQSPGSVYYTVGPGDSLAAIAARYGVPVAAIAQANNLTDWNFVWYGQRLVIPGTTNIQGVNPPAPAPVVVQQAPANAAPAPANAPTTGKWIDVDVTHQTITAYEGNTALKTILVSTGLPRTPTVIGTYHINRKYESIRMTGGTPGIDYYDLPGVPYTMFFFEGYAIHGTYWHNNFGHPMSHGCVNLPTDEAKWFYDWAPMGTTVVTHL